LFNNLKYLIHFANLKIRVKTAVFIRGNKAQAAVEYAIVLIILVITCIGVIALFSGALGAMFNKLANTRAGLLGVGP